MKLPDIEVVAAMIHDAWMEANRSQGITSRQTADGVEQMVPYNELPEHVKDLDRAAVGAVYRAIKAANKEEAAGRAEP